MNLCDMKAYIFALSPNPVIFLHQARYFFIGKWNAIHVIDCVIARIKSTNVGLPGGLSRVGQNGRSMCAS